MQKPVIEHSQVLMEFSQGSIYMVGAGFVLGSLFTVFLLLVLDYMRRNKAPQ